MWFVPTKKEMVLELGKIQTEFSKRDETINELKTKLDNLSLKVATLEGAYYVKSQSLSQKVVSVSNKSQPSFDTKILNSIKKNKKSMIMSEILKLLDTHTALELYNRIVIEKGLCSKASFYRYYSSLKSQKLLVSNKEKP